MNGAESLVHTLLKSGVDCCFANPGTSEMHFVAALDRIPGMRCVLCLQENVVTGAADGYYRITGRPAATLLHCGPGLANGLANLHNARRARSGIVNIVGDQATYHRPLDAPLTADVESWARPVSSWVRTTSAADRVGADAAAAVAAARTPPGGIATLILPSDTSWNDGGVVGAPMPWPTPSPIDPHGVQRAARVLRERKNVLLLLGANAVHERAQRLVWRIAAMTGAKLMTEGSNARTQRGRGRLPLERVPYANDPAVAALAPYEHLILVSATAPVGFFAYPNKPGQFARPGAEIHLLARPEQDAEAALQALVDELGAPAADIPDNGPAPGIVAGKPTPESLATTIAAVLPEGAVVVDESVSYGRGFFKNTHAAAPHDWLQIMGGAIGAGIPLATGAAIGLRTNGQTQRRVLALQADGSAMYTVQGLWTQVREKLPVTTVILSNRKYQILIGEYFSVGVNPGPTAMNMLDLGNPDIGWVKLASSLGMEAAQADTLEVCADLMKQSFRRSEPFLIELTI
jgi:acetolactate synthase I/II/III large subunit